MTGGTARRGAHLELVESARTSGSPPIMIDPRAREEFERLTQTLVDIAIEITDLLDGDADLEPGGDEFEVDEGA